MTFLEAVAAIERSDLREDVKTTAINDLIGQALAERGIVFASEEQQAHIYAKLRAEAMQPHLQDCVSK